MDFATHLKDGPVIIGDGGLGTTLQARGAATDHPLWSTHVVRTSPLLVQDVHESFFRSGAEVATTATYQGSIEGLLRAGLELQDARALLLSALQIALHASHQFSDPKYIIGSCGPYGAMIGEGAEYTGAYNLSSEELRIFHQERAEILWNSGLISALAFETIPQLEETRAILSVLDSMPTAVAYISFQLKDEDHLASGEPFALAIEVASSHPRIIALGINCVSPAVATAALGTLRDKAPHTPRIVYANMGFTWAGEKWQEDPDFAYEDYLREWLLLDVAFIGGCCGVEPRHISIIKECLRKLGVSSARSS